MAQERDDLVYLAKLAEQAERFDEMVERRRFDIRRGAAFGAAPHLATERRKSREGSDADCVNFARRRDRSNPRLSAEIIGRGATGQERAPARRSRTCARSCWPSSTRRAIDGGDAGSRRLSHRVAARVVRLIFHTGASSRASSRSPTAKAVAHRRLHEEDRDGARRRGVALS